MSVYGFEVNPKGVSTTVALTDTTAAAGAVQLYADPGCKVALTGNELIVTTPTRFYVLAHGTYKLSLTVQAEQWATKQNQPRTVDIRAELGTQSFSPFGPFILGNVHTV